MIDRLGLVPASPDGSLRPDIGAKHARELGADVLYAYLNWADGLDWTRTDALMNALQAGGRVAINLGIVHTTVLGKLPSGWSSLLDRGFAGYFTAFATQFAQRYNPEFLFVGNEANIYLAKRPTERAVYAKIVHQVTLACRNLCPATKVGVVLAMPRNWLVSPIEDQIAAGAELVGWTCYGNATDFSFSDVQRAANQLDVARTLFPHKAFAVVETGWNTSPTLGSNESEQAQYAAAVREFLARSDAEFVNWFLLRDGKDCTEAALRFFPPGARVDTKALARFKEFLQYFGIERADGSMKPAGKALTFAFLEVSP
jgi:hypothetical protein